MTDRPADAVKRYLEEHPVIPAAIALLLIVSLAAIALGWVPGLGSGSQASEEMNQVCKERFGQEWKYQGWSNAGTRPVIMCNNGKEAGTTPMPYRIAKMLDQNSTVYKDEW
jgi:hypothetical protein